MDLVSYITQVITAYDSNTIDQKALEALRAEHGSTSATYSEVEEAIAFMTRSLLQDIAIGEQVQGVFNQSVMEILVRKGVLLPEDITNVSDIMREATNQLYADIKKPTTVSEDENK